MIMTKYFLDYLHNWGKNMSYTHRLGSCENVISEEAVTKLNLKTEPHQSPYKLT